jgi:glycogen operon protein
VLEKIFATECPQTFMNTKYTFEPGSPLPFGATVTPDGVNLALFSRNATAVTLVLFVPVSEQSVATETIEIPLEPLLNKTGDVWHVLVCGAGPNLLYGFRAAGVDDPQGSGHCFRKDTLLIDPYARALADGEEWGGRPPARSGGRRSGFSRACQVADDHFDWQGDRPLNIPLKDSIIYEMHVRGYTRHPSSGVNHPGTYRGIVEKIPYLKELGVTAVELMPVFEFNENENVHINPFSGELLKNFWGYSPLAFFAPKASYAANGANGDQVREFKEMVKALHRAGIEVILDVVFNHTAEGGANGPVSSFRGLDNTIYYLLDPETRDYLNYSGCGNTLNCNHPLVRKLIMDCLHYWVIEMHVDGFRFDLASVLGRDQNGEVLSNPPMVEKISEDPILAKTKIIAEAWDAAGLYQVGSFSTSPRWAEWNGRFRDDVRAFMCGMNDTVPALATRLAGSADLYQRYERTPYNSINFVTSHDGFTLHDLVSYNTKDNTSNGEDNRDGSNHNISWNSGTEGETEDPAIVRLRARRMRSLAVMLFLSQGVPMFVAGDEFGRTQFGNNNAYCQDNPVGWVDWTLTEGNRDLLRFFKELIGLRKGHPVFRRGEFFPHGDHGMFPEIRWQSTRLGRQDWSPQCKALAFFLDGRGVEDERDDDFFVMLNGHKQTSRTFDVPCPEENRVWRKIIDTSDLPPGDIVAEQEALPLKGRRKVRVQPMAAVVLISKPKKKN